MPDIVSRHDPVPAILFSAGFIVLTLVMQVHEFNSEAFDIIGEGLLMAPTVPVGTFSMSFRLNLSYHF
jgi:hypothetical protein